MFELEQAIKNWRNGLLQNQNVLESDANELESHLRDEVDSLMLAGLNAEEAFMVSSHRIGDEEAVGQEFAKVNPSLAWRRRAFWMFFGILASMLVGGISGICSTASVALLTR
ncbi:MAG: permease prefix domain 1-containing protein, partial [Planctomycetota bacterium]